MPYSDIAKQRQYQREWMSNRRDTWIANNGPCVGCGTWDGLQVDHIDHTVKVNHRVWSWAKERRDVELAKCQVLCWGCHDAKSASDGSAVRRLNQYTHGTSSMYKNQMCRCDECKAWNAADSRRLRAARKQRDKQSA